MCRYRVAELKHGRTAMLAALGFIVQPWFHPLAGPLGIKHPEEALTAMRETPILGWVQVYRKAFPPPKPRAREKDKKRPRRRPKKEKTQPPTPTTAGLLASAPTVKTEKTKKGK